MKRIILLSLAVLLTSVAANGQGIDFRQISFAEAIKIAKKENKAIFIDVYTSWCGPCKALSTETFPLPEVGEAFNSRFLAIKVDAEKSEDGKLIVKRFGVTAYPTLLFVNGDSELVYRFLGYRDAKGIVEEAVKAQAAFQAYPTLKKFETQYKAGKKSKDFLREYSTLKIGAGMDCGQVLADYFNLLSDSEIMESANVAWIEKLTVIDDGLITRLIRMDSLETAAQRLDKKQIAAFNKAIGQYLGNCIDVASHKETPEDFEKIGEYKKIYFTIPGNGSSIVMAGMGGGIVYVPWEITALEYYGLHRFPEKFIATYDHYLAAVKKDYEAKKEARERLDKKFADEIAAAEKTGDQKEVDKIKKNMGLVNLFTGVDDYFAVGTLIDNVDKYLEFYPEKGPKLNERMIEDYMFMSRYYPSCKTAMVLAEKLVALDRPELARQVLQLGLEKGAKAFDVKPADVEKCQEMLQGLN